MLLLLPLWRDSKVCCKSVILAAENKLQTINSETNIPHPSISKLYIPCVSAALKEQNIYISCEHLPYSINSTTNCRARLKVHAGNCNVASTSVAKYSTMFDTAKKLEHVHYLA